jgi:uncharacterized protein YbjT (DUF2867 family)
MTILVTGGTGAIGSEVTRQLLAAGERPRLLLRNPDKAQGIETRIDIAKGDMGDREAVQAAMRGVDRLFLLATGPEMPRLDQVAVAEAKQAGVGHIVKLSVAGADMETLSLARWHRHGEKAIQAAGIPSTFVRPVNFMSNALTWADSIRSADAVFLPTGEGRVAYVDPADVAGVCVRALLGGAAHHGKEYLLTGPEALTTAEMVGIIGRALGRTLRFVDMVSDDFERQMSSAGLPAAMVAAYVELYSVMRDGQLDFVAPTVELVLGRKPGSFADWVQRLVAAFRS